MFHRLIIDQLEAMMSTVMFGPVFLFNLLLQGLSIPGPGTKLLVFSFIGAHANRDIKTSVFSQSD